MSQQGTDLALYEHLALRREATGIAARIRSAKSVDLSKADRDCQRCGGTGLLLDERVKSGGSGEVTVYRVACACVKRNGGVEEDLLDRLTRKENSP